jgi:hypothetical protein
LRLAHGRWPGTIVIDIANKKAGRPPELDVAVADQILVHEIAGIKVGYRKQVQQLAAGGQTVARIAEEIKLDEKQVRRLLRGQDITDEAAVRIHLALKGRRSRNDETRRKVEHRWVVRHSRAVKVFGRPAL